MYNFVISHYFCNTPVRVGTSRNFSNSLFAGAASHVICYDEMNKLCLVAGKSAKICGNFAISTDVKIQREGINNEKA